MSKLDREEQELYEKTMEEEMNRSFKLLEPPEWTGFTTITWSMWIEEARDE